MTPPPTTTIDGWSLSEALSAQDPPKPVAAPKPPIKLTRTQRLELHKQLHAAVLAADPVKVSELISAGAPVVMPNARDAVDLFRHALEHFHPQVMDILVANGAICNPNGHPNVALKKGDPAAIQYMLNTQGSWPMDEHGTQAYEQSAEQLGGAQRHMAVWMGAVCWAYNAALLNPELRPAIMRGVQEVERRFPSLPAAIFTHRIHRQSAGDMVHVLLQEGSVHHTDAVATSVVSADAWRNAVVRMCDSIHNINFTPKLEVEHMAHLEHMLTHAHVGVGFAQALADMAQNNQDWKAATGYGGQPRSLLDAWLEEPDLKGVKDSVGYHQNMLTYLGMSRAETINANPNLQSMLRQYCAATKNRHDRGLVSTVRQAPPTQMLPQSGSPSFTALLLESAAPALKMLLGTPNGRSALTTALADATVAHRFARAAPQPLFSAVVRALPELTSWTDSHGNTLAHHRVHEKNANKTFVEHLVALNPDWMMQKNNQGFSVRDLIIHPDVGGASPETIAHLDAKMMGKAVRASAEVKRKIHGKSGSRKM